MHPHRASLPSIPSPTLPSIDATFHTDGSIPLPPSHSLYTPFNHLKPVPRRSLPELTPHSLNDAQLYPYVLRAALWHDRSSKLGSSAASSLTATARSVFGFKPNDKAADPAYSSVKLKCDDKHLYRDLNLYIKRLELGITPGRRAPDFPNSQAYKAWLHLEKNSVLSEIHALALKDPKVTKKSKLGGSTSNPTSNTPLFIPPFADDGFVTVLRKIINQSSSTGSSGDWLSLEIVSLLDLLQRRWRINPSFKFLIMLERVTFVQLLVAPSVSPEKLHAISSHDSHHASNALTEIESILDFLLKFAKDSDTSWTTAQCSLTHHIITDLVSAVANRLQNYAQFYPLSQFVPTIATLSRLIFKSDHLLELVPLPEFNKASQKQPNIDPQLRNAALARSRHHVKTVMLEFLQGTAAKDELAVPDDSVTLNYSIAPNERIFDLCTLVKADLSDMKQAFLDESPRPLGLPDRESHALLILQHQLLSDLFLYIGEHGTKPARTQPIFEIFNYYNLVVEMSNEFCNTHAKIHGRTDDPTSILMQRFADWFQDAVDDWIDKTSETMTNQWTHRIIEQDQFVVQQHSSDMQSTSVVDLYSALHQEVDVIRSLAWPSFHHEYRASKKFAKTMCSTLIQYANHIQGQIIAILLQMEDAAEELGAADSESISSSSLSISSTSLSLSDRSKSFMNRLKSALVHQMDKDQTVSSKVTRSIRIPVSFSEQLCVRMNNLYAAKRRVDGLYTHLISALSLDLPEDSYVSPYPRDETLLEMANVFVEMDLPTTGYDKDASGVFWVEVGLKGTPLGRTPTHPGVVRIAGSSHSLRIPNIDSSEVVHVPGTSSVTVDLTVYAAAIGGESATTSMHGLGSLIPTSEEIMAKSKGGLVAGTCSVAVDVGSVVNPVDIKYPVETINVSQWSLRHFLDTRRMCVHVCWKRKESMYMYHFFDRVYSELSEMIDNGLLMMANQIGKWIKEYMLQLVKQYKLSVLAKAFGGSGPDLTKDKAEISSSAGGEKSGSAFVSFKTRGGRKEISFVTVEADMQPLLDYLNSTLEVLNSHMHETLTTRLFKRVWRDVVGAIEWQVTGRREKPSGKWKQLDQAQVAVLQRALKLLYDFFHVDGDGLPQNMLQSRQYHRLAGILQYYHSEIDDLMAMYQSTINFYLTSEVDALARRAKVRPTKFPPRGASLADQGEGAEVDQVSTTDIEEVMTYLTLKRVPAESDTMPKSAKKKKPTVQARFQTVMRSRAGTGFSAGDFFSKADSCSLDRQLQPPANVWRDSDSDELDATGDEQGSGPEPLNDQAAEFGLEALARQEAIWTILCLHADTDNHECQDFVTEQAAAMRRVLDNMRAESSGAALG